MKTSVFGYGVSDTGARHGGGDESAEHGLCYPGGKPLTLEQALKLQNEIGVDATVLEFSEGKDPIPLQQNNAGIVLGISCDDEDCGMRSVFEFFGDGSHRKIMNACWHSKRMPTRDKILKAIEAEQSEVQL